MISGSPILWLLPLAPLIGAVVAGVLAISRRGEKLAPAFTAGATLASGLVAATTAASPIGVSAHWLSVGGLHADLGVHPDALSLTMACTVCFVSFLVQVYSIGYMAGESGYARYFAYLGLFTASMLGLVVADNLLQLYACWELVGICSYLLIGFWWRKPSAANAAKKAFIMTRFGDMGFLLGVLLLTSLAGSFDFGTVGSAVHGLATGARTHAPLVSPHTFLLIAPLLLFCGAVGKSAQFPLFVWLPDAMEGPTPVSALIHAATMVAAGVYMVGRLLPIFAASAVAMDLVLLTGAVTALIAATIAITQTDIKKVMAYSTVSQLGYMMMAMGAGGLAGRSAGFFHLTTHAVFKALLFLAAGSVIHALHHSGNPNDLRAMGGLRKSMPTTAYTCLIGVLALTGFPLLSGFFSKDAVLAALEAAAQGRPAAALALVIGVVVAGITAFYGLRMWLMAFHGAPRSEAAAAAHEAPRWMTGPLVVLAVPSVGLGLYLHRVDFFRSMFASGAASPEPVDWTLAGVAILVALAGYAVAWRLYGGVEMASDPVERMPAPIYRLLSNGWYVDAFWNRAGAAGALALGRGIAWVDRNVVDRAVDRVGGGCAVAGAVVRRASNGQVQSYAVAMLIAILFLTALHTWGGALAGGQAAAKPPIRARTYTPQNRAESPFAHVVLVRNGR